MEGQAGRLPLTNLLCQARNKNKFKIIARNFVLKHREFSYQLIVDMLLGFKTVNNENKVTNKIK